MKKKHLSLIGILLLNSNVFAPPKHHEAPTSGAAAFEGKAGPAQEWNKDLVLRAANASGIKFNLTNQETFLFNIAEKISLHLSSNLFLSKDIVKLLEKAQKMFTPEELNFRLYSKITGSFLLDENTFEEIEKHPRFPFFRSFDGFSNTLNIIGLQEEEALARLLRPIRSAQDGAASAAASAAEPEITQEEIALIEKSLANLTIIADLAQLTPELIAAMNKAKFSVVVGTGAQLNDGMPHLNQLNNLYLNLTECNSQDQMQGFYNDTHMGSFLPGMIGLRFFGENHIESIQDYFLLNCMSLKKIDFRALKRLKEIGYFFLVNCNKLKSIDLGPLSQITTIKWGFLVGCYKLEKIDLGPLSQVTSIGNDFLSSNSFQEVDLSSLSQVKSIGAFFLSINSFQEVDLSSLSQVTSIGNNFLSSNLFQEVDLGPLSQVTSIGDGFLYCCCSLQRVILKGLPEEKKEMFKAAMRASGIIAQVTIIE